MRVVLAKKNTSSRKEKRAVTRFLQLQLLVFLSLVVIVGATLGRHSAQSTTLGGLVCLLPNIFLAGFLFARTHQRSAQQVLKASFVGELLKLVLIALLMVIILHVFHVLLEPFLIGFMGTYAVYLLAPLIIRAKNE